MHNIPKSRNGAKDSEAIDRKSTRLNSSHQAISYAVFCLKKKTEFDEDTNIVTLFLVDAPELPFPTMPKYNVVSRLRAQVLPLRIYPALLFFLNDPAPTEIYTLPLHDPLPI